MNTKTYTEREFTKRFMMAMALFLILIAVQTFAIELMDLSTWMIVAFTLLPVLPLVWALFIYMSRFRGLDEYMQRLTSEALIWTTGILCFTSFAYGMLAMKFPMPEVSFAFIMPAVFGGHGLVFQVLMWERRDEE